MGFLDTEMKYGRNKVEIWPMAEIFKNDICRYWIFVDICKVEFLDNL